jgi:Restriction endonuclease
MTAYDATELARLVEQVRATARGRSNHAKGAAMADLVAHVFGQVPGVELRHREFLDQDRSSEIDLVFRNQPQVSGLFDGVTLLVECKNEARPISTAEVRIFGSKLAERNQPVGVMITRAGLSGQSRNKTAAHGTVGLELANGRTIVVLTLQDLEGLCDSNQFVNLCTERRFELEAFRTYNSI